MIYEIKDVAKVKRMFEFWYPFDVVDVELRVFVTDPDAPRSALLYSPFDGIFLAGEPDREAETSLIRRFGLRPTELRLPTSS